MAILETWSGRTSGQTDADSPLDTTLMDGIRKDLDHLKQVVYGDSEGSGTYFTPVWGHDHDGVNSKNIMLADNNTSWGKLRLTEEFFFYDDFMTPTEGVGTYYPWNMYAGITNTSERGGAWRILGGYIQQYRGTGGGAGAGGLNCKLSSGDLTAIFRVKLMAGVTNNVRVGIHSGNGMLGTNGVYFDKETSGSYRWKVNTRSSSTTTTTTLDVSPSAGIYDVLKIVANTTSVKFYVNGVLKATHTTNIPTADIGLIVEELGGVNYLHVDAVAAFGSR